MTLSAARHRKLFSLVGIRARYNLLTNLNHPFLERNIRWQVEPSTNVINQGVIRLLYLKIQKVNRYIM